MKVAITGATGLLGGNLAVLLAEAGYEVVCTRRSGSRTEHLAHLPIVWKEADLADVLGLSRAFEGAEAVFHCAAFVSMWRGDEERMWKANVGGTEAVLEAVRRASVRRLVHVSTIDAIGISEDGTPADETTPWNWDRLGIESGYARSKRAAEERVLEAAEKDVDAVIVNPSFLIGPYDRKPSSGRLVLEVARRRMPFYPSGIKNFADVRDAARGMLLAFEKGRRGERYILGGENLPIRDALALIAEEAGVPPPRLPLPKRAAQVAGRIGDFASRVVGRDLGLTRTVTEMAFLEQPVSCAKAARELGYVVSPLRDAVRACLAWLRATGRL